MTALKTSRWAALPVVLAGTFLVVLDFFIVNVALPSMQARPAREHGAIEWVVAGYALTSAVLLITAGRLGDRSAAGGRSWRASALFTLALRGLRARAERRGARAARLVQGVGGGDAHAATCCRSSA